MRIGLIGAGAVAPLHARAAALIPGVEMAAVCDLDHSAAAKVADPIGAKVFTDYRELIRSRTVDAVIVNTPHGLHHEMTLTAVGAGLDVLVEKPMATTVGDCDAMIAAAHRAGVVLRVGHIQHFMPEKLAAVDAIARGDIGEVQMVHDFRTTDYRPGTRSPWFFSPTLAGGGVMMNIGVHCADRVVWLGGAPGNSVSATMLDRFGTGVETDATLRIRLSGGVTASVTIVSDLPHKVDELTLVGSKGSIVIDTRRGTFLQRDGRTDVLHEASDADIPEAFRRQLADFSAAVRGRPSAVSQAHSRHVIELIQAAYRSAANDGQAEPVADGTTAAAV